MRGDGVGRQTLTVDERNALYRSATGLDAASVAEILGHSPATVRGLLASAIRKLGARSKLEAVVLALRSGLIQLPASSSPAEQDSDS